MFRYAVPRYVAMVITSLQLIQMIIGCSVNYLAYQYKQNGMLFVPRSSHLAIEQYMSVDFKIPWHVNNASHLCTLSISFLSHRHITVLGI